MFGSEPNNLGRQCTPNLLISAQRMLCVDLSQSTMALQAHHSVTAWRPSLENHLWIGTLVIAPEGVLEILL
jgi:hypothetical protein